MTKIDHPNTKTNQNQDLAQPKLTQTDQKIAKNDQKFTLQTPNLTNKRLKPPKIKT